MRNRAEREGLGLTKLDTAFYSEPVSPRLMDARIEPEDRSNLDLVLNNGDFWKKEDEPDLDFQIEAKKQEIETIKKTKLLEKLTRLADRELNKSSKLEKSPSKQRSQNSKSVTSINRSKWRATSISSMRNSSAKRRRTITN